MKFDRLAFRRMTFSKMLLYRMTLSLITHGRITFSRITISILTTAYKVQAMFKCYFTVVSYALKMFVNTCFLLSILFRAENLN
jgi:hypothetical protein